MNNQNEDSAISDFNFDKEELNELDVENQENN